MINKIAVKKIGMTTVFDEQGFTVPVTLVQPFTLTVTEIKRPEKQGYSAVQLGYLETTAKHIKKPRLGVLQKAGTSKLLAKSYESRQDELADLTLGQELKPADLVEGWAMIKATGTSKGKGFAGAVKRWGFRGQQRTHGDPDNRKPQSNNATDPARVFKGSRRPGHLGAAQITVRGLKLQSYNADLNLLAIKGSVPGPVGGTVFLTLMSKAEVK